MRDLNHFGQRYLNSQVAKDMYIMINKCINKNCNNERHRPDWKLCNDCAMIVLAHCDEVLTTITQEMIDKLKQEA